MRKSGYCSSLFTPVNLSVWLDWPINNSPPAPSFQFYFLLTIHPNLQTAFLGYLLLQPHSSLNHSFKFSVVDDA